MSRLTAPEPRTLVAALLLAEGVEDAAVLDEVGGAFAPHREFQGWAPFTQSRYYETEMGPGLRRGYAELGGRWDPGALAELKLRAVELEVRWSRNGRRRVNLDPGLLALGQLVLATGKPAAHRVYLGQGVYAEVEYRYEWGSFQPLPWTYPDYREEPVVRFFNAVRERHRADALGR